MAPTFFGRSISALISLLLLSTSAAHSLSHKHPRHQIQKREPPVSPNLPSGWTHEGCYTDSVGARTLSAAFYGDGTGMTAQTCIAYCTQAGFNYAATEYSSECFCGNVLASTGTLADPTTCSMTCSGDATTQCGGPDRLTVFWNGNAPPVDPSEGSGGEGWSSLGCWNDHGIAARTLPIIMPTPGGQSALTVGLCTAACQEAGWTLAGLEYGSECFCGNKTMNGGAPATGCNMHCNGNPLETCGGPDRLNLYGMNGAQANGWSYKGCYIDNAQGRILMNQRPDSTTNSNEACIDTCLGLGYSVAGTQYSSQCFCDNFLHNGAALTAESECNMACSGKASENCGAGDRMSVYSNATLQVYQPPALQKTDLPGDWKYKGCILDLQVPRSLKWQLTLNNNTATECLSRCQEYGYGAGGMEYGNECWCGDEKSVKDLGRDTTPYPDSDCNMPCPGDPRFLCGNGNRIAYYTWTGTPLSNWDFPTGPAAGEYRFFVPGVVIPLITSVAVNGKITFLEKHGTGAPNTTGAYELDPTLVGNGPWEPAWREMTVKTDVFCAAGLTLPDKAGRQINIGGWANDDTKGVRLYTPDGSPGTQGVNNWQEDVQTISLQQGRWYPTGLIMTNGSILVVGGQVGSNGAPVPTLEVLPKPAGGYVKFCDWLQRTDPNNLYPFLAVLPGGGIFVAYYNEARILDPVTFDTVKTLPNIPASVNDPAGGRSYPFEGTAVLMPQVAPYSAPLRMMICGGSNPGPEIAIDNCVSTEPEATDPKWTIERMPSARVVTIMTALPDGTYLILGGGMQGRAGFGTLNEPNFNAVLYDPSKPVNARMSVMANTTVARMYHSEAILMPDGRVLVSGSDPQDPEDFPQEYRVEVFMPPYLLSGLAQPTFEILGAGGAPSTAATHSYAYNAPITVSVQHTGAGPLKASIMAIDSSTHGSSMGQRTIFPDIACTGSVCTITTPPDGKVCPPGWHQLFILDGPTPSHSKFIRIGGDPAELGNWPQASGFTTPGL